MTFAKKNWVGKYKIQIQIHIQNTNTNTNTNTGPNTNFCWPFLAKNIFKIHQEKIAGWPNTNTNTYTNTNIRVFPNPDLKGSIKSGPKKKNPKQVAHKKKTSEKNLRKSAKRIEDKLNEHYAKYILPKFGDIANLKTRRKEIK